MVQTRRLSPDESDLHRQIRLAALRESPRSFGQSYAEAAEQPMSYWEDLTRSVTAPARQTMILACLDETICGSAYGLLDRERTDIGRIGGMWVDPGYRRQGIATALLAALRQWALNESFAALYLWAPAHETGALALYSRVGFRETGQRQPFASADSEIVEMSLSINRDHTS